MYVRRDAARTADVTASEHGDATVARVRTDTSTTVADDDDAVVRHRADGSARPVPRGARRQRRRWRRGSRWQEAVLVDVRRWRVDHAVEQVAVVVRRRRGQVAIV